MNNSKATVFFHKYEPYNYPKNSSPNWYLHWMINNYCAHDLNRFNTSSYSTLNLRGEYAHTDFMANKTTGIITSNLVIFNSSTTINDIINSAQGIHCFNTVIWHELGHIDIKMGFWKNGYDPKDDSDMDLYPDSWEETTGASFGFTKGENDAKQGGLGEIYEENICRSIEKTKFDQGDCDDFDLMDWSYDRSVKPYQGKQWK
ncbi:MAG TPA: hypothetical protein PKK64_06310 [Saprospiraceae bacterium]|nr:hypothetical protein [Chitinophagales bacterium]HMW39654.1 hypothetical protein [Saprospiraceae bacterium]HNL05560.1 hypothetical protein [Bacteroidia bacterium]HMX88335.1 hypothetical protein [Saprospiraceae bacterium]HNA65144.1 hypothetical protein [Saprospiraceae bacterium]